MTAPPPDTDAHTAQHNTANTTPAAHNRVRSLPRHIAHSGSSATRALHGHTAENPLPAGSAHTQLSTTHPSDDSPDTTLGKLPLIWLLPKLRDLS